MMPIYSYKCKKCDREFDVFKPVELYKQPEVCFICDGKTDRVISCVQVSRPHFDYYDASLGATITSSSQERKIMKKRGMIDARDTPQYQARLKGQKWTKPKEAYDPISDSMSNYVLEGVRQGINTQEKIEKWSKEKKKQKEKKSKLSTA